MTKGSGSGWHPQLSLGHPTFKTKRSASAVQHFASYYEDDMFQDFLIFFGPGPPNAAEKAMKKTGDTMLLLL